MPVLTDFDLNRYEDGLLVVNVNPAVPIGGWSIQFLAERRFGGSSGGLIVKSAASGYGGGASGITILSSGGGQFRVQIDSADTSGRDPGDYAFSINRLDSGSRTLISQGYMRLMPNVLT